LDIFYLPSERIDLTNVIIPGPPGQSGSLTTRTIRFYFFIPLLFPKAKGGGLKEKGGGKSASPPYILREGLKKNFGG
jgi:hypothetical protein